MQAWVLDESPGDYVWREIDDPEVGPDDVRVKVVTSALNHMDLWLTRGRPRPKVPHVPGCDVAGVVESVGPSVTGIAVGDEVVVNAAVCPIEAVVALGIDAPLGRGLQIVGEQRWGGHGEFVVVPSRNVVPRPAGRSWDECAAYPLAYLTAYRTLRRARLRAGETLVVVGVGGGVSSATLALGVAMGARVYGTSRDDAKRAWAISQGAIDAFDSAADTFPVKADVVAENVGPATWEQSMACLKPGGRLVTCGGTSGQEVPVNLPKLFFKQLELIGSTMGSYPEFDDVTALVANGLPVVVDETFALTDYPKALERLESGAQLGKIVLDHGWRP